LFVIRSWKGGQAMKKAIEIQIYQLISQPIECERGNTCFIPKTIG